MNHLSLRQKIDINDCLRETYSANSQIKFKTLMLKSNLCDYSDAYIIVKGNLTVTNTSVAAEAAATNIVNKKVIFKNFAPFTDSISENNNT